MDIGLHGMCSVEQLVKHNTFYAGSQHTKFNTAINATLIP